MTGRARFGDTKRVTDPVSHFEVQMLELPRLSPCRPCRCRVPCPLVSTDQASGATEFSDRSTNRACVEKNRLVQVGRRFVNFWTDRFWTTRVRKIIAPGSRRDSPRAWPAGSDRPASRGGSDSRRRPGNAASMRAFAWIGSTKRSLRRTICGRHSRCCCRRGNRDRRSHGRPRR